MSEHDEGTSGDCGGGIRAFSLLIGLMAERV